MHLQLQQQSLLIGRRPTGFTEHYYTEWDDGLGKERISLFLVMSIDSTQVPGAEIGKEAFQLLQDHFLNDLSGDPYDRFEAALREINIMFNDKEKELGLKFVPNVHVVCGVIQKDALFLSQRGDAQGYLVRKRHVSSITDGLYDERNTDDLFQNIASGVLEVGDSIVLVTGHLVQYVTPNDLSKIFSEQSLEEALAELKDLLHGDIEDQMATLSFEVLEKTEDVPVVAEEEDEEEDDEIEDVEGKEAKAEAKIDKTIMAADDSDERSQRIKKSIGILRSWLTHEERWAWLKTVKTWERSKLLKVIGGIAVVLVIGVMLLFVTTSKQRELADLEGKLAIAEENITQAETRGSFDKDEAALLLNEAEELAVEVLASGYLGSTASQLVDRIEEQRDFLDNVIHVDDELKLLVDFSDLLGSASIMGVEPYDDRMVVYTENEAYQVLIDEVQTPSNIDNTEKVVAADYFEDRQSIVMLTSSGHLIEYTDGNAQFADTADVEWKDGVAITTYSSKIYILDSENGEIWKYQRGTSGYGSASAYVDAGAEVPADVSDGISLAIDGSVWVLNDDGSILQLLSGEAVDFDIKKAPLTSLDGAVKIYTELDINQLYLLDPANDRLLIFNKSTQTSDLTYSSQYVFDDLKGELKDMFVDKERDVIVIVTDLGLYELSF